MRWRIAQVLRRVLRLLICVKVDGEGDKALRREWSFFGFWHLSSAWLLKKMHDVEPEHIFYFHCG
jgi:hypothetical protein